MTQLGIGIVGTGNIAGGYARDALTHPEIRLVAATDLDPARAAAFAEEHGCRAHASLDDLLADDEVDIVINLTVHHAHYDVTKRALEAGRHVYSEKPLALNSSGGARARRARRGTRAPPRLLAVDVSRRSAADGRGADPERPPGTGASGLRRGELGPDRDLAPGAGAVLRRRRAGRRRGLPADPGHDDARAGPLGPGVGLGPDAGSPHDRRDAIPDRQPGPDRDGHRARGWRGVAAHDELLCRAPGEAETGSLEFHGDDASLALGSFQDFDATVEVGAYGKSYEPVALVRPGYRGTAWARGVAEMASAIAEGRPHRASAEQAAHVVDILEAAALSMADGGRPIEIALDVRRAAADAVGSPETESVRRSAEPSASPSPSSSANGCCQTVLLRWLASTTVGRPSRSFQRVWIWTSSVSPTSRRMTL